MSVNFVMTEGLHLFTYLNYIHHDMILLPKFIKTVIIQNVFSGTDRQNIDRLRQTGQEFYRLKCRIV
jgi:hypothetical protein